VLVLTLPSADHDQQDQLHGYLPLLLSFA